MSDVTIVDARGLSCPEPVIRTKKALGSLGGGRVDILVDTVTARENVSRYARSQGWTAEAKEETSNRQAEAIISDAKIRAERILLDAASERDSLAGEMIRIRQERQHFIAEFHGLLSRFKSILDATEKPSEPAAEAGCGQSGA